MPAYACLHVPAIGVQAARRLRFGPAELDVAVATYRVVGDRRVIVEASPAAAEAGVRAGLTVSAAEGACTELVSVLVDPVAAAQALAALGDALFAFGPIVGMGLRLPGGEALAFPDTVWVDISRVAGPPATVASLEAAALTVGLEAQAAIAPEPWTALVLAGDPSVAERRRAPPTASEASHLIAPLPLSSARLPSPVGAALSGIGIRTIGAFLALPVAGLARRFGRMAPAIWRALRGLSVLQANSHIALIPYQPDDVISEAMPFDESVLDLEALSFRLRLMLDRVLERLRGRGLAAAALELTVAIEPGIESGDPWQSVALPAARSRSHRLELELAEPQSDPRLLADLLRGRLLALPPPGPATGLTLTVSRTAALHARQLGLFDDPEPRETIAATVARLASLVGDDRFIPELIEDFRPERAWVLRALTEPSRAPPPIRMPPSAPPGPRPTRVFREPEPIASPITLASPSPAGAVTGPERLVSGWWDSEPMARDYWVVADRWGRRSWIFRDLASSSWFRHGVFD